MILKLQIYLNKMNIKILWIEEQLLYFYLKIALFRKYCLFII